MPVRWTVEREQFRQSKSICRAPDLGQCLVHLMIIQKSSERGRQVVERAGTGSGQRRPRSATFQKLFVAEKANTGKLDQTIFKLSSKTIILHVQEYNASDAQ